MSFKKGAAITGFSFGLINASDGSSVTSGTVSGFVSKDGGAQTSLTNSITHIGNGQWKVDITSTEMNADLVSLTFTEASSIPVFFNITTQEKLVSELKDETMRGTDGANTSTPPSVSAIASAVTSDIDSNSTKLDVPVSSRMATFTYTAPDNSSISSILADTNELQQNQVDISGLMLASSYEAPDNTGIANLVSNQGNWVTATGFATVNYDDTSVLNSIASLNDISATDVWNSPTRELTSAGAGGATAQEVWEYSTRELTSAGSGGATIGEIRTELDKLNDFDPTSESVVASNMVDISDLMLASSYVAPDNVGIAELVSNQGNWSTATGFATVNYDPSSVLNSIANLNDISASDVWSSPSRELTSTSSSGVTLQEVRDELAKLNDISINEIMDGGDIDSYTLEEALRLILSTSVGKVSGSSTNAIQIRSADDSKVRIDATVDTVGNRLNVIKDAT